MRRLGELRRAFLVLAVFLVSIAFVTLVNVLQIRNGKAILAGEPLAPAENRMRLPRLMFWAWERPDDLSFLDPQNAGVAFLAATIHLRPEPRSTTGSPSEGVTLRPRLQPLRLPPRMPLMAVVRIETPRGLSPDRYRPIARIDSVETEAYTGGQRERIVAMILNLTSLPEVRAVQIDFDATKSEQAFYRALLEELRKRLSPKVPLSITALASWCLGDPWLKDLAPGTINEAVPMLFRMGPDAADVASLLKKGGEFNVPACRMSLGVSTDESLSRAILSGQLNQNPHSGDKKTIYVFSSQTWTRERTSATIREVKHGTANSLRGANSRAVFSFP